MRIMGMRISKNKTSRIIAIFIGAMYYVKEGQPMWPEGPSAPFGGYITKGDNPKTNPSYDQQGSISYLQPVKKEWIDGVARFPRVPLLGCVSLASRGIFTCL